MNKLKQASFLLVILALALVPSAFLSQAFTVHPGVIFHTTTGTIQFSDTIYTNNIVATTTDRWTFANIYMDGSSVTAFGINVQNADAVLTDFNLDGHTRITVSASTGTTSTVQISSSDGRPSHVYVDGDSTSDYSYDEATGILSINLVHSSDVLVHFAWLGGELVQPDLTLITQYWGVGDLIGFISATLVLSMGQLAYAILVLILVLPLYVRYQSIEAVTAVWLVTGTFFQLLIPFYVFNVGHVLLALGVASLLYRLFHRD